MKAFIVKFKGEPICAIQSTINLSKKMLKQGYRIETADITPILTSEIAVKHGLTWEHAPQFAMYDGKKIAYRYTFC